MFAACRRFSLTERVNKRKLTPVIVGFLFMSILIGCIRNVSGAETTPAVPQRVNIVGYNSDAMEPFVTRDGRYLLFNNLNGPPNTNTDIFYAERIDDFDWRLRGKVDGVDTPALEGCPTMDSNGHMYFVSPRDYGKTLCTIYTGLFKDGKVTGVRTVESISRKQPYMVNFDVDVSADGKTMVFVDSQFLPIIGSTYARLVIAEWNGRQFARRPNSDRLMAQVNSGKMQYAPTISLDKLTLYFTRFDPGSKYPGPQIFRSVRPSLTSPFGPPVHIDGLGNFVEGTCLSSDGGLLYFHRKDGNIYHLYAVSLP
jgi:hypothetical protein